MAETTRGHLVLIRHIREPVYGAGREVLQGQLVVAAKSSPFHAVELLLLLLLLMTKLHYGSRTVSAIGLIHVILIIIIVHFYCANV